MKRKITGKSRSAADGGLSVNRARRAGLAVLSLWIAMLMMASAAPAYGSLFIVENSLMPILSFDVSRQDPAIIGEEFSIVYLVRNISDKPRPRPS